MTQVPNNASIPSVALITIGLDQTLADQIADAASGMLWAVHRWDCDGYISVDKRPPFSQSVKSSQYCIAVIDFDTDIDQAIDAAAYIQQVFFSRAVLVALSTKQDRDTLLRAMRAGCNDFLSGEFDATTFAETLNQLNQQWNTKAARNAARGSVLTFFGAKGGVGTTTLAVHVAIYLVQCHNKKTLLIDNHPQLGHACIYLGIDGSRYNFHELVRNLNRLDSELLRGYIATHSSGLEVLSSPDTCEGRKATDPESMAQTLDFLRGEYDYVIVDCSTSLDETNLAVFDASNQVYLIATPEIGSVRDLSRHVDVLSQNEQNADKVKVVINRFAAQHAVSLEQIEKAIRLPIAFKLPNSYAEVVRSGIMGEPISYKSKTEFSAQLLKWTSSLGGAVIEEEEIAPKKSKFSLWK
ncbi:MAG: AAA family ATPase [Acidobacteriaceae bacterium]